MVVNLPGCGYELHHHESKAVPSQAGYIKLSADLAYWKIPRVLSTGVPLGRVTSHIPVYMPLAGGGCANLGL